MTINELPKIAKLGTGESVKYKLNNHQITSFVFETSTDNSTAEIIVKGYPQSGEAKQLPFLLKKNGESAYTDVSADGKVIKHQGTDPVIWIATVIGEKIANYGAETITVSITGTTVKGIVALQNQPRYSGDYE